MSDNERANLRKAVEQIVVAASALLPQSIAHERVRAQLQSGGVSGICITTVEVFDHTRGHPLSPAQQFALSVLVGEPDEVIERALADYMLDRGFDYAQAAYEKGRREEREAIAERLYSEASHVLGREPDPNDLHEFAAAALSSVADDLTFGVPPTAPKATE